jgi:hypothetical protein
MDVYEPTGPVRGSNSKHPRYDFRGVNCDNRNGPLVTRTYIACFYPMAMDNRWIVHDQRKKLFEILSVTWL